MKRTIKTFAFLSSITLSSLLFIPSCQTYSPHSETLQAMNFHPSLPTEIMGRGKISPNQMKKFLIAHNKALSPPLAQHIANLYVEEAGAEGINHDIAFAQMCHETAFLKFGGQVKPYQNNYAGLGATDDGAEGAHFPNPTIGVRAHIQHLKVYATKIPLRKFVVDPRYDLVTPGIAPTIFQLSKRWASDPRYAEKILGKLESLYKRAKVIR